MVDGGSEDAGMAVASIHACPRFKAFNSHKASEVARANSRHCRESISWQPISIKTPSATLGSGGVMYFILEYVGNVV